MNGRSSRVGLRQWKALVAVDRAYPDSLTGQQIHESIEGKHTPAHVVALLESLLRRRLLAHSCADEPHDAGYECQYRITESGRDARLQGRGVGFYLAPPTAALAA